MELFCENGCLTDEALRAVRDGTLDETARLEASEHMSFCDACLLRYTDLLTDDVLAAPPAPLAPAVMRHIRVRTLRVAVNRYARVAAVAALALALWSTGVFDSLVPKPAGPDRDALSRQSAPPISAGAYVNDFFRNTGDSISAAFDSLAERLARAKPDPAQS